MTDSLADALVGAVEGVTKKWAKQKRAEERSASAISRRAESMTRTRQMTIKEAAWSVMESAYLKASAGNTLPAAARQIMYAARPEIQKKTGRGLRSEYFTQTLLPDYLTENQATTATWNVVFDARGHFKEPHTGTSVDLGTIGVRNYLHRSSSTSSEPEKFAFEGITFDYLYPTTGPTNRFGAVLFIEKEGFMPLFDQAGIAAKYDIAIMSTKGMSNTASRELADSLCAQGHRLLVLHDFDKAGFSILSTLRESNRRYSFSHGHAAQVIDLGVRLEDVEEYGLQSESVSHRSDPRWNLANNGATPAEIEFLLHERVELNAFASDQLIEWIEAKLKDHGIEKVVPDEQVLVAAYRRALELHLIDKEMERIANEVKANLAAAAIQTDLETAVRDALAEEPTRSWDNVISELAEKAVPTK